MSEKTLGDDSSKKVSLVDSTPGVQVSSKQPEPLLTSAEIAASRKLNSAVETALNDYMPPSDIDIGGRRRGSRGSRSAKKRVTKRKRNKKSNRRRKSRRVN
jgi:hypothetical protein